MQREVGKEGEKEDTNSSVSKRTRVRGPKKQVRSATERQHSDAREKMGIQKKAAISKLVLLLLQKREKTATSKKINGSQRKKKKSRPQKVARRETQRKRRGDNPCSRPSLPWKTTAVTVCVQSSRGDNVPRQNPRERKRPVKLLRKIKGAKGVSKTENAM